MNSIGSIQATAAEDNNQLNFTSDCECSDLTSEEYSPVYVMYNFVVVIVCMPVVAVLGIVGNMLNIWLFTRHRFV